MIHEIKTFIAGSDLDQVVKRRIELIHEIQLGILNRSDYSDELVCLELRIAELTGGLFATAFNMANSFGRSYLLDMLNYYTFLSIHKTASNWFYLEVQHKENNYPYYYAISQCSDCKSTTFGDLDHFNRNNSDVIGIIN